MRKIHSNFLLAAILATGLPAVAQNGVEVTAAGFGVHITTTGSDAIRILDSTDDGIQIGSSPDYPSYGVYIPSPGVTTYGLWPNTANASGNWALFTVDNISAANISAASVSLLAHVAGAETLEPGDIVTATGVGPINDEYPAATVAVQHAISTSSGIVGVVQTRMQWVEPLGKDGERALESAAGPAQPGDYVMITALGVALVKVEPGIAIASGQRLTIAERSGHARPLRTRRIDDFTVTEGTPTIGVALEVSAGDKESLLVFVSTR